MSAKPQSKEQEIIDSIFEYFVKGEVPEKEVVMLLEHEISRLPIGERAYASAWLKGACGKHLDAVRLFKDALSSGDPAIAQNYMAYLSRSAHNYEHRVELFRLVEEYPSHDMRLIARNAAFCIGNDKLVKKFSLKMAALKDGEERDGIIYQGTYMAERIVEFKNATKLSSRELEMLCDSAEAIANKRGVNCSGVNFYLGGDEDNAFIVKAQTDDPNTLADMNMELLLLLSDGQYCNHPFTSWFQSDEKRGIY